MSMLAQSPAHDPPKGGASSGLPPGGSWPAADLFTARGRAAASVLRGWNPQLAAVLQPAQVWSGGDDSATAAAHAVQAFWPCLARCLTEALRQQPDSAVAHGLDLQALARQSGLSALQELAGLVLGHVLVGADDLDSAVLVLQQLAPLAEPVNPVQRGLLGHLVLALVGLDRPDQAQSVAERWPALRFPQALALDPSSRVVAALLLLQQGRPVEARQVLPEDDEQPEHDGLDLAGARAWVQAQTALALGQGARAHELAWRQLRLAHGAGPTLAPMVQAGLYRAVSQACEDQADLAGALAALKCAQAGHRPLLDAATQWRLQALRCDILALADAQPAGRLGPVAQAAHQAAEEWRTAAPLSAAEPAPPFSAPAEGLRPDPLAGAQTAGAADAANGLATTAAAAGPADGHASSLRFLAHVAHEMRNPLQGVLGMTALLELTDLNVDQRQHLLIAESSAQMVLALCNDVLDLAMMETGRFEVRPGTVDLPALLDEVRQVFVPLARTQGLQVLADWGPSLPKRVRADGLRLKQVLMNLLSNAVKFTRQGQVSLRARSVRVSADQVRLSLAVVDSGPGLDAQAQALLFNEFSRVQAAGEQPVPGAGLGLALSRRLVQAMGGQLWLDSTPGHGSTFGLDLLLRCLPDDDDAQSDWDSLPMPLA